MLNVQAVIFDMDGVLIDSEPLYMEQEQRSYARYGVTLDPTELSKFVGTTQRYMWRVIKQDYALTESLEVLMAQHHAQLLSRLAKEPLLAMPGVSALLTLLNNAGIPCAVASSSPRELVDIILRKTQLLTFFKTVVCGDDVTHSKPDPDIFLLAAKRLGIAPEQCLVIEDSHHGVTAAKAAAMRCVGYQNANSGQQNLSAADIRVEHHDQIKQWLCGQ